jgi:hypothetical protein
MSLLSFRPVAAAIAVIASANILSPGDLQAQKDSDWVGTYKGPFVTDGPSGNMTFTFAQENKVWKVNAAAEAEGAPPASGDARDVKIEGNNFSFAQTFGEYDVLFKGTKEGDLLKGTLEAYQAGSMVGSGTFELKKQP